MGKSFTIKKREVEAIISESVDELSISQKKRNIDNAIDVFKKGRSGYNNIKTFGIVSAENSDSDEMPQSINRKNTKSLSDALKSARYAFTKQRGHFFGNDEWSYFIFNIKPEVVAYFAGLYQQTSFIYSQLEGNKVISQYYEKADRNAPYDEKRNPYVVKDTAEGYIDASNDSDYSELGGKFRYTIPFTIFDKVDEGLEQNLSLIKESNDFAIDFSMRKSGLSPIFMRQQINKGLYDVK